jgi:ribosomal protein RSM22 (predicted rRNA methylase)
MDLLARRVEELSDLYTLERHLLGGPSPRRGLLLPRFFYFLCSDAPKVHLVLSELASRGEWETVDPGPAEHAAAVVDLGCGVGASTAGLLLSLAPRHPAARRVELALRGVDSDPTVLAIWRDVVEAAAELAGVRVRTEVEVADLREFDPAQDDSLVICQGALNECQEPPPASGAAIAAGGAIARRVACWAARRPVILIEPALRITTRPLHALRDAVLESAGEGAARTSPTPVERVETHPVRVLAPCPHQSRCPMLAAARDWCHEVRLWPPTPRVAEVQKFTRRRDDRVKYSFVVLGPVRGGPVTALRAEARLVSDPLPSKGKVERVICTRGGALRHLRLLDRDRSPANRALATSPRGTLVSIEALGDFDRVGAEVLVRSLPPRP